MDVYVIRHQLSEANNRDNYGTPAFDNPDAPLMPAGRDGAVILGRQLVAEFGIQVSSEPVAVSMMRRSQETAIVAGFRKLHLYPELNEVKGGLSDSEISAALAQKRPPQATHDAARYLLEHPPEEGIWVTHALLIASLCQQLGVYQSARFIPKFGEVRRLQI